MLLVLVAIYSPTIKGDNAKSSINYFQFSIESIENKCIRILREKMESKKFRRKYGRRSRLKIKKFNLKLFYFMHTPFLLFIFSHHKGNYFYLIILLFNLNIKERIS